MLNTKIIKRVPNSIPYMKKQIMFQWLSLITNIFMTVLLVSVLTSQFEASTYIKLITIVLLLLLRCLFMKRVTRYSFENTSYVKSSLRTDLFKKITRLSVDYKKIVSTSELVQLSVEGINQLETYFGLYVPQLFYSLLSPLTLFIIVSFIDIKVALILFIFVPLIPVSIIVIQKIAKRLLSKYWDSYTTLGDSFLENLEGLTTLKIFKSDEDKHKQMNVEAETFRKVTMKVLIMQLNSISVMDIVAYGGAALGNYMAIVSFRNDHISLFSALFIMLISFEFFIPLRQLGSFFHIAMNGIAASDKMLKILDADEVLREKSIDGDVESIDLSHLKFGYDERVILDDVSLTIKKGQFTSIVGESGSGKSTIVKLVAGLLRDYEGDLSINGIPQKTISDESLYSHIYYVTHMPFIMKGTLRDNLMSQQSDDVLWAALKEVSLDEFFKQQNGLETLILESGSNLSGGQKQRLNIARALLSYQNVFIFDEATSNIDVESEEMILDLIQSLSKTNTVIMVTHRLSAVRDSDYIYVLENGCIQEEGQHDDLMNNNGLYKRLLNQQKELEEYQHV